MFNELYITVFTFRIVLEYGVEKLNVAFQTPKDITENERLKMRKNAYINVLNKYEHEVIIAIELKSEITRCII